MLVKPLLHYGDKIYLYTSIQRKTLYISLKLSCEKSFWDEKTGLVKRSHPNADIINSRIINQRNYLEKIILENPDANRETVVKFYKTLGENKFVQGKITLLEFAKKFRDECRDGKYKRARNTIKCYGTHINRFEEFISQGNKLDFDGINKDTYDNFIGFLRKKKFFNREEEKNLSENTIGDSIKFLKMMLREARERGLYNGDEYLRKYFKKPHEDTDSIALDENEIQKIIKLNLDSYPYLQFERDRFIVQYYLVLRHSDCLAITEGNFYKKDGKRYFQITSQKTNSLSHVPVKPLVWDICKKYKFNFNRESNQESNRKLKTIGQLAGIIEPVSLNGETMPKFMYMTTHTARRSLATNLYMKGVSDHVIMALGGWKNLQVFKKYIKINNLQSAQIASNLEFYQ